MSFPRDKVGLDPDAVGILEKDRVVAGCPCVFPWGANNGRVELQRGCIDRIDVASATRAKTQVVQTRAKLAECFALVPEPYGRDGDSRAATNEIEIVRCVAQVTISND